MIEEEEFFSPNHKRLLSIAVWAKYLAWVALVVYILNAVFQIIQHETLSNGIRAQVSVQFMEQFSFSINMGITLVRGLVSYLVLKGISLGLNMIVETDINYREQKGGAE